MGFPLLVLVALVHRDGAHPLLLGAGVLALPMVLFQAARHRAAARRAATDAQIILITIVAISVSAMVSLLMLLMTSPGRDPDFERVAKVIAFASVAMQMALGRPLIQPTKQRRPPRDPRWRRAPSTPR